MKPLELLLEVREAELRYARKGLKDAQERLDKALAEVNLVRRNLGLGPVNAWGGGMEEIVLVKKGG